MKGNASANKNPNITDFTFDHATETDWLLLSDAHEDFETAAIQLCELVTVKEINGSARLPQKVRL